MKVHGNSLSGSGVVLEHPQSELDRNPFDFLYPKVTQAQQLLRSLQVAISSTVTIPGFDVSKWNPDGDWKVMVDGGWSFAVIKANEGADPNPDPLFYSHLEKAIAARALVMVYTFFRSNVSGVVQAQNCLNIIQPLLQYQNKTVVWIDIETADGTSNSVRIQRVKDFIDTIRAAGQEVGIYCSAPLWQSLMSPVPAWISTVWQWVAHWTSAAQPTLPSGWTFAKCILWQIGIWNNYSWCPAVPGWQPDLDIDYAFFASREEMEETLGIEYLIDPLPPDPEFNGRIINNVNFRTWPVVATCTYISTLSAGKLVNTTGKVWSGCGYTWSELIVDGVLGWCLSSSIAPN